MQTAYDIVIIGGGPAGLSFACSMIGADVKVLVVEKLLTERFSTYQNYRSKTGRFLPFM